MSTCTCTEPCATCTCNAVSDDVIQVYQELKEFVDSNYEEIKSMVRDGLVTDVVEINGKINDQYQVSNDTLKAISLKFFLENTVKVWKEPQRYLIPKVCRDIILNILREVYLRAEVPWKTIFPSNRLHMKVSVGDINLGIVYADIKSFPEMEFSSYEDLFEGMDLTPNYRVFDRTPYGSVMNWFVNLDWIRFLSKSVNIAPATGSDAYEVPVSEVLKGSLIYNCINMAIKDLILTEDLVSVDDSYILYGNKYVLSKVCTKAADDPAIALGFKKVQA